MGLGDLIFNIPPDIEVVVNFKLKGHIWVTYSQSVFLPFNAIITDQVKELAYNMSNLKEPIESYKITYYEKTRP